MTSRGSAARSQADQDCRSPARERRGRRDFESLAHALLAILISGASLAFAAYLLLPQSSRPWNSSSPVLAAAPTEQVGLEVAGDKQLPLSLSRVEIVAQKPSNGVAAPEEPPAQLTCLVVDDSWRPVEGAEVWVDEGVWQDAGRSDKEGVITLTYDAADWLRRFAAGRPVRLGARSHEHGPALVTSLHAMPTGPVRLILRGSGAGLLVEVTDTLGRPIAGARIAFHDELLPQAPSTLAVLNASGNYTRPTPVQPTTTGAWGRAQLFGLEPGERRISIERNGYHTQHISLTLIEGEVFEQWLRMERAAGVRGHVLRADGGPLEGVVITGTGPDATMTVSTTCDAEGKFELGGLPGGPVSLFAEVIADERVTHAARTTRTLHPGEWWRWNPTLSPVELLSGRLLDSWGDGLAGWGVRLRGGEEGGEADTLTDDDGRYELPCPHKFATAQVFFFHPEAIGGLPSRIMTLEEAEVELPPVELEEGLELASRIRGRLLKPNGQPAPGQSIALHRMIDHSVLTIHPNKETGEFETPALPPGEYMLVLPDHGSGWTPDELFALDGRNVLDLGIVELPVKGKLSLYTQDPDRRTGSVNLRMELLRPGIASGHGLPVFIGAAEVPMQFSLAPGNYRLELPQEDGVEIIEYTIESGQTTHVILQGNE
jgi:hypothetical protein